MKRKLLYGFLAIVVIGLSVAVYMWNKPHKKVENAAGLAVTAVDLYKAYAADENKANGLYLNKALEVSGVVLEADKNQDGGTMLILETGDPIANVQCAMREKEIKAAKGQKVSIKGFCSGSGITGISLTDCILK